MEVSLNFFIRLDFSLLLVKPPEYSSSFLQTSFYNRKQTAAKVASPDTPPYEVASLETVLEYNLPKI